MQWTAVKCEDAEDKNSSWKIVNEEGLFIASTHSEANAKFIACLPTFARFSITLTTTLGAFCVGSEGDLGRIVSSATSEKLDLFGSFDIEQAMISLGMIERKLISSYARRERSIVDTQAICPKEWLVSRVRVLRDVKYIHEAMCVSSAFRICEKDIVDMIRNNIMRGSTYDQAVKKVERDLCSTVRGEWGKRERA